MHNVVKKRFSGKLSLSELPVECFFFRENAEDLHFIALKRKGFQLHPPRRQLYRVRVLQLMYILGLRNQGTQAQRSGSGPKGRLLFDFIQ